MKTLFISAFTLSFFILLGCKTTKELTDKNDSITEANTETISQNEANPNNTLTEVSKNDSLFASIYRSPCYGTCPTYKMEIYNSGFVHLEGIRFMEPIGHFYTYVSPKEIQAFIDKANFIEFMKMDDKYDSPITDIPSATTSIVINGVRKEVYRRHNYPQRILQLEQLFDDLLKSKEWSPLDN